MLRGGNPPIPKLLELTDEIPALGFEPEVVDELIGFQGKSPFIAAAMLKKALAREIVLAHGPWQRVNRGLRHGEGSGGPGESEMKSFLIAVNVLIEEIRMIVEPESEGKGAPATLLIHDNLA